MLENNGVRDASTIFDENRFHEQCIETMISQVRKYLMSRHGAYLGSVDDLFTASPIE